MSALPFLLSFFCASSKEYLYNGICWQYSLLLNYQKNVTNLGSNFKEKNQQHTLYHKLNSVISVRCRKN